MKNSFLSHLGASAPLSPLHMDMTGMAGQSAIIKETDGGEGKKYMWLSEYTGLSIRLLYTGMLIFVWDVLYSITYVYNTNITCISIV